MSAGTARAAVDVLLSLSGGIDGCEIDFFGGEPLLNMATVKETVSYGKSRSLESGKRLAFTLTTNAVSLGPEEAAYLDSSMHNVILSLDGRPEVHDRMRPMAGDRSSHRVILDNVRRFVELRGERDYWVRGTFTAHNLDFTEDVRYLADQGLSNISLEPVVGGEVGSGRWGLGPEHVEAISAEYLRLAEFIHERATAGRPLTFFHFIAEPEAAPCYAKRVRGCGAGREYLAVTPEGDVYPCHQFVTWEHYRTGRLEDLRKRALPGEKSAEVGSLWVGSKDECRRCWARYRCSGGCHANALAATGDVLRPDPLGCALVKARLEASLYLEALGRPESASGSGG